MLKRVVMRGSIDPTQQRITLEHGDLGTKELGGRQDEGITVALSGQFDYGGEPRLALGIACNPMSAAALKRLWPSFLTPKVRDWVMQHVVSGNVDRLDIAVNAHARGAASRRPAAAGRGTVDRDRRQRGRRCGRSRACRRSATPISTSASTAAWPR